MDSSPPSTLPTRAAHINATDPTYVVLSRTEIPFTTILDESSCMLQGEMWHAELRQSIVGARMQSLCVRDHGVPESVFDKEDEFVEVELPRPSCISSQGFFDESFFNENPDEQLASLRKAIAGGRPGDEAVVAGLAVVCRMSLITGSCQLKLWYRPEGGLAAAIMTQGSPDTKPDV